MRISQEFPDYSRQQIQALIKQGKIQISGQVMTKPGVLVAIDAPVTGAIEPPKYVSRAGFKLEAALDQFSIDVHNKVALDAGISTGGFTDCLLQKGARRVYGVDVGHGLVHERILRDDRLILMERTNLRYIGTLNKIPELIDIITLDLSFISLLKVIDAVIPLLAPDGHIITLIKPQFEVQRHDLGRGGIIRDASLHQEVINQVTAGFSDLGLVRMGLIDSPIAGGSGNKEFLAVFMRK